MGMIRIIREGVVVYESESLYDIADWLYYEEQGVKEMIVTVNEAANDKTKTVMYDRFLVN